MTQEGSFRPIAIVGIGGLFPGAPGLDGFWGTVRDGIDTSREIPAGRWAVEPSSILGGAEPEIDRVRSIRACLLDRLPLETIRDAIRTGIAPGLTLDRVSALDPSVLVALVAGIEAWRTARTERLDRARVSVHLGHLILPTDGASAVGAAILGDTVRETLFGPSADDADRRPAGTTIGDPRNALGGGLPASALQRALGLGGGSETLDAACASSLYAIAQACAELADGRVDAALAGGVSRPDALYTQMGFSQLRALSPTGRCHPFDGRGQGLVVGEGAGIFLLRRLEDAERDGDEIHGVIRGVGLSNDRAGSLLAPERGGQLRALRAAYTSAGWHPTEVDLIECHATGTPVGDATEFGSLRELWGEDGWQPGQCSLGSVKANIGHLLTAAGAASLTRALLALRHRTLPPTANFEAPNSKIEADGSPFRFPTSARPWEPPPGGRPRRAAISAFGFGGINAHLLVEEAPGPTGRADRSPRRPPLEIRAREPIAIIGLAGQVGSWRDEELLGRLLGAETRTDGRTDRPRWFGVEESDWFRRSALRALAPRARRLGPLSLPAGRFRIPPTELADCLPQQLWLLETARRALLDAGIGGDGAVGIDLGERASVFAGIPLDLASTRFHLRWLARGWGERWLAEEGIELSAEERERWLTALPDSLCEPLTAPRVMGSLGSIVASRVAREFRAGGPSHTYTTDETSGLRALERAVRGLRSGELDLALVGAVDLGGDVRSEVSRARFAPGSSRGESRPFSLDGSGGALSEGVVSLVLKRLDDAERDGDRVQAVIEGIAFAGGGGIDPPRPAREAWRRAIDRALEDARIDGDRIRLVLAGTSGAPEEDAIEAGVLIEARLGRPDRPAALSCAGLHVGHTGSAAGLMNLLQGTAAVAHDLLPSFPVGTRLRAGAEEELARRFRLAEAPEPWWTGAGDGPRRVLVGCGGIDGNVGQLVLREAAPAATRLSRPSPLRRAEPPPAVLVVEGAGDGDLLRAIDALEATLPDDPAAPLHRIARERLLRSPPDPARPRAIGFAASRAGELRRRLESAREVLRGRRTVEAAERELSGGATFFSHRTPLGVVGEVALLFPGSGNDHPGQGRDLLARFPRGWRELSAVSGTLAEQLPREALWPTPGDPPFDPSELDRILGHVTVASLAGDLLLRCGVRPTAAIGYSLGETASMFALGVWRDRDAMLRRLAGSTLFTRELAGPCRAAARAWGLPAGTPARWNAGIVPRSAAEVRRAIGRRSRVSLQIINTPTECVIGGDPLEVAEVVRELGTDFFPVHGVTTVHSPVLRGVESEYLDLHRFPVHPPAGIEIYSPYRGAPHAPTSEGIARSITDQGLHGFDYVRCIEHAYAAGARVFLETGPGSSCTRMVDAILGDRPHRALSLVRAREPLELSLARIGAACLAERAPFDSSLLHGEGDESVVASVASGAPAITRESGGDPFDLPPLPAGVRRASGPRGRGISPPSSEAPAPTPLAPAPPAPVPLAHERRASETPGPAPTPEESGSFGGGGRLPEVRSVATAPRAAAAGAAAPQLAIAALVRRQRALLAEIGRPLGASSLATGPAPRTEPSAPTAVPEAHLPRGGAPAEGERTVHPADATAWLPRALCLEFGRGAITTALRARLDDPRLQEIDTFPTRVRLPDEPLMLVDRILTVEGEPFSLAGGRIVTEHDVLPDAWYLDAGRAPVCISVESGQADLFLAAWLGADLRTRGLAVYRLLDAEVTFHRDLPRIGETIRYDIRIDRFFEQGDSLLFHFHFEATIDGAPVLTMKEGCAGFFPEAALAAGRGIVEPRSRPRPAAIAPPGWRHPSGLGECRLDAPQLEALRAGDLAAAFGPRFSGLPLARPATIPGRRSTPTGRMHLLDRVTSLDPTGGHWGLGRVTAELDVRPDDWFLTCHFTDDPVMPGTLMFECTLHTLRVLVLGLGWIGEEGAVEVHPVIGEPGRLRCRGQVIPSSRVVGYDVSIRSISLDPEPTIVADAKMLVDGREIVEMRGLSMRLPGLTREGIDALWSAPPAPSPAPPASPLPPPPPPTPERAHLYDHASILAFALGKPSEAFGEEYRRFDDDFIARLPAPPYCFIDGITEVEGPPWIQQEGTRCVAEYTVPPDAWYFSAVGQERMPFAVLLETALQPCGWLAAYCGSALTSQEPMHFRNLGGRATQHRAVTPRTGLLRTEVRLTSFSASAGMLIQHYDMEIRDAEGPVYTGTTYFGFFPRPALANQLGIRDAVPPGFPLPDLPGVPAFPVPQHPRLPDARFRMVERIDALDRRGGPRGLGSIRGSIAVDPDAWFFRAHFHQDPVWPGSLGLESMLQLMEVFALDRWTPAPEEELQAVACGEAHEWTYRGQVLGHRDRVTVEVLITEIDEERRLIRGDGRLLVDGLWIYGMDGFTVAIVPAAGPR
ncbi:MAG: beta-ketoacyl synthase N-terminal-like domain-containing protein [Planctomycetota bacterium]|jgi:acyl transferase domain-containing protein/3-hydroxymyristoyl/3-hydroxydecanoyl-(acyl carrier protein) dehydratase